VKQLPKDIQPRLTYKQKNAAEMVKTESELFKQAELLILDPQGIGRGGGGILVRTRGMFINQVACVCKLRIPSFPA